MTARTAAAALAGSVTPTPAPPHGPGGIRGDGAGTDPGGGTAREHTDAGTSCPAPSAPRPPAPRTPTQPPPDPARERVRARLDTA